MLLQRLAIYHPLKNLNVTSYVKRCANHSRVFQDTRVLHVYHHHSHAHNATEVCDAESINHLSFHSATEVSQGTLWGIFSQISLAYAVFYFCSGLNGPKALLASQPPAKGGS